MTTPSPSLASRSQLFVCYYTGFNVENIKYKNFRMDCWDAGGQESVRVVFFTTPIPTPIPTPIRIHTRTSIHKVYACDTRSPQNSCSSVSGCCCIVDWYALSLQFRSMWKAYCQHSNAIIFVVDSSDTER